MRIRIVKKHHRYKLGDIVEVSKNEAFGLLDSGVGVVSKDMVQEDYKITKPDEEKSKQGDINGNTTFVRPHRRSIS